MRLMTIIFISIASFSALGAEALQYYGDGIRNSFAPWTEEFQGMCHNDDNYYAVQRDQLWKIPKTIAMEKVKKSSKGVIKVPIPDYLKKQNGNHLGDCDTFKDHVYVPLEGTKPVKILVFDANTLRLIGAPDLTEQSDAPWVTVDAEDGSIISGNFNFNQKTGIVRYQLSSDLKTLTPIGRIYFPIDLNRIQGLEVVRSQNLIWAVSDQENGGLYGFNLTTGQLEHRRVVSYQHDFPKSEELEGIDSLEKDEPLLPHYRGNLFVTMLNNNIILKDGAYLKLFEY